MKKIYSTIFAISLSTLSIAQTWTKISSITDSTQVKVVAEINNQLVVAGQNWTTNNKTDYAVSNDGNTWAKLPTFQFAGFYPTGLPQNNLIVSSNGFTSTQKLVGNAWQTFANYGNNYAEFTNGTIIGGHAGFPDTLYTFSATGVRGAKISNQKFKLSYKYCNGANNRLFIFSYGSGLGYIDYSNLSVINFPATLDGTAMTETAWQGYLITDMIKTSNGTLLAVDRLNYGVIKSTDNGLNWTSVLSGVASASITKNSLDEIFILVGNSQIRKSSDLGVTFTNISGDLPANGFKADVFVNANDEVFAFVNNNGGVDATKSGIFKLSTTTSINEKSLVAFNMYPNPTNSVINIEFLNFNKTATDIEITNTLGQVVLSKTITENNTQLNVRNFTKGIYFVTLKSDNNVSTQKLIIE